MTACGSGEPDQPAVRDLSLLTRSGGMPNLHVHDDERMYLSWVEFLNDSTDALYFALLEPTRWSSPRTVALGTNWFSNWADFPSVATYSGNFNFMAAHWLQMRGMGTYDYDVHIAQSQDGGRRWNASMIPHRDSVSAEHGFVSLVPLPDWKMLAVWLDGREMALDTSGHGHAHAGNMTLRSAVFDTQGNLSDEHVLDDRVCECCQTDAVLSGHDIIVVYRNRSAEEVRDIALVRYTDGRWTDPQLVFADGWKIAGCPVNGPAVDAHADALAVAWYTAADTVPQVRIAFSYDGGDTFSDPVRVDAGAPLGRVDVVMLSREEALVSWIETVGDTAEVRVQRVIPKRRVGDPLTVAATDPSRKSGFPVMGKAGERIVFAWTEVDDQLTRVRSAQVSLAELR